MITVNVYKDNDGRLRGVTAEDERAQRKWKKFVDSLAPGEHATYQVEIPRNPAQHGRFMAMTRRLLERTEAFTDFDALRDWLTIGAGYMVQDAEGKWVAQSIAFDSMDGVEFGELFRKVEDFLWSDRARRTLWRHLTPAQHNDAITQLLASRGEG